MGGQGRSVLERRQQDPADDAVPAGAPPDLIAARVEDVEGLAEDQLVDRMVAGHGPGVDIGHRHNAVHGPHRAEGGGAHNPFQRLLGQIGPGEGGADIKAGGGFGQTLARPDEPFS